MDVIIPSFLIIGERKCGTSSLYRYLVSHPNVLPCKIKEPQFFSNPDGFISQHYDEYLRLFPRKDESGPVIFNWPELDERGILHEEEVSIEKIPGMDYITGEASANLLYEADPSIVFKYLPDVKLIICIRDPVQRAFSHYRMFERFIEEGRNLDIDMEDFTTDMQKEIVQFDKGKKGEFIAPGVFVDQVEKWMKVFSTSSIFIMHTYELKNPESGDILLNELVGFLGLPRFNFREALSMHYNKAPKRVIPDDAEKILRAFYHPHNERLFDLMGKRFEWL